MATVKLNGILTDVFPIERPTGNFFKKVFWLKEPDTERYPQHWQIELHNDDTKRLDGISVGDRLVVEVEIRGKKYSGGSGEAIYNTLKAVGILVTQKAETVPNKAGTFKPIHKPGREHDQDRKKEQGELPL